MNSNSLAPGGKLQWQPIFPVPLDALPPNENDLAYHNKEFGCSPSLRYPYQSPSGELLGYIIRWDMQINGKPEKETRPYLYCESNTGKKGWRSQGFPELRPLYNLHRMAQKPEATILVCEGEKTADAAAKLFLDHVATTAMHGAQSPHKTDWSPVKERCVIISPDHDEAGKKYADDAYQLCIKAGAASVQLMSPTVFARYAIENGNIVEQNRALPEKHDLADAVEEGWIAEHIDQLENRLRQSGESLFIDYAPLLKEGVFNDSNVITPRIVTLRELLATQLPSREDILSPWLQTQSLSMVFAKRGVGKTHFALGVAWAVASGGEFLGWRAPRPREVIYIDGEMPGIALQERLANICRNDESEHADNLKILTPDLQGGGMPNLATEEGQEQINALLTPETKLIIVDNLSCLVRGVRENEGQSWDTVGGWALQMRKRGISVIFVHHAGKDGNQRGTSRKEDILDVVINLKHPSDYNPEQGACFELHFEKARHLMGKDVAACMAQLITSECGQQVWKVESLDESNKSKIIELHQDGVSPQEIAEIMGVNRSTIYRHLQAAREKGIILPTKKRKKS